MIQFDNNRNKIKHFSCGDAFVIAVTEDQNKVYAWGNFSQIDLDEK